MGKLAKFIFFYTDEDEGVKPVPVKWETATGVSPLSLVNALAHSIKSLAQYGKCVQASTPTPSAPVDIMCNNGALRYGALGQNLLDPSAANTILGYYINKADGEQKVAASNFMFAGFMPVTPGKTYVAYGRRKTDNDLSDYNRIAWYDSNKNWLSGADYTQNRIAVATAPENAAYARFSCNPSGTTTVTVTQELVDGYNWMFAEGTAEIVPFEPFAGGIYADGTPEVISLCGNLYDSNSVVTGKAVRAGNISETNPLGSEFENSAWNCSDYIAVKPNTTYTTIVPSQSPAGGAGLVFFANTTVESAISGVTATAQNAATEYSFTTPSGCKYLRFSWASSGGTDAMLYENSQVQTASVADLLAVGDYADEQNIISGIKTGKVGVKVLDGTETGWTQATTTGGVLRFYLPFDGAATPTGAREQVASTHFVYAAEGQDLGIAFLSAQTRVYFIPTDQTMTFTTWKAWLAAQYAAGTPVIVLYPLSEETTESVTPQPLNTTNGTNTVTVTAEVSPIQLSVEYAQPIAQ